MKYKVLCTIYLKVFLVILTLFTTYYLLPTIDQALAATSTNQDYNLEIQNIDTTPEKTIPAPVPQVLGVETKPGGIQSISQLPPISFAVTPSLIDFGALSPSNPVKRTSSIMVSGNQINYQVVAFTDHPPIEPGSSTIPDTTCDNGACSEIDEAIWSNNLTYGFGYHCRNLIGIDCDSLDPMEYYKQFSDISKQEKPQTIMSGYIQNGETSSEITLKLNTAGNQKQGIYTNTITFLAVPNF